MNKLEFDFQKAKMQEARLEETILNLNQMILEKYNTCFEEIGLIWSGEEGKEFQYKMQLQKDRMMHTAETLKQAKDALYEARIKAKITEEKMKEIAEVRIYE